MDLFVYGTLMVPEVMRAVCGHTGPGEAGLLVDYRRRQVLGEVYPAITACKGESVEGLVYRNLGSVQMKALDLFEGELYCRALVDVRTRRSEAAIWTYVLAPEYRHVLSDEPWSLAMFRTQGLAAFLSAYKGFAVLADAQDTHDRR